MKVRVFIACSLDGFIAGPNDELDWLEGPDGVEDTFTPFFKGIGAMLMGRRTYDAASSFEGDWPYGDIPIIVATNRPLQMAKPSVQGYQGTIEELVAKAKTMSEGGDVYVDGGNLIRQALDVGLVDDITLTLIPIVLGDGIPLFNGAKQMHRLELCSQRAIGGGMVELVYESAKVSS
ncbi:MAG: dihydrofolate reductase family protein [Dehalococcoidia bacterium]